MSSSASNLQPTGVPGEPAASLKQRMVLLGPPASGKGTQAERIQARYGLAVTSTGAMLRAEAQAGSELGRAAEAHTNRGELVPDELILDLVAEWLEEHNGAFVFDGFPRTLGQGIALEQLLAERGTPLDVVFFFQTSEEVIHDRVLNRLTCHSCGHVFRMGLQVPNEDAACLHCGGKLGRRSDDNEAVLKDRLAQYHEKTEPLVSFYRERGILMELSANESPDAVFSQIVNVLEGLA